MNIQHLAKLVNCILSFVLLFVLTPVSSVNATNDSGDIDNALMWSIEDECLTLQDTHGMWTATFDNYTCTVKGEALDSKIISSKDLLSPENESVIKWLNDHPIGKISLDITNCNSSITNDKYLRSISDIEISEEVKYICHNAFVGTEKLQNVYIFSRTIDLIGSGIGYSSENEILENITIYGYIGSTAENYANENGFTFIALDEQPTTTTTPEPTITTMTTTITPTTTATTGETKTDSTTATTIATTDIITTEEIATIVTHTEQTTEPLTTDTGDGVSTKNSTAPPTTTTGTETTLPQTGYSKWYHAAAALAVCMIGIGGAMVIGSGAQKKRR